MRLHVVQALGLLEGARLAPYAEQLVESLEDEDDGVSLAAKVAALSGRRKRALCVADSSDDEPSQVT